MTGVGFGLSLIGRLLEVYPGVVVGMKDSTGDWERIETVCREFPGFSVFAGTERYLLDTLRHGGAGCISATVNVTSRLARRVYDSHEAGQDDEARELREHLTVLRTEIEAFPQIPALKRIMARLADADGWHNIRPPLVGLEDYQAARLLARLPLAELL
jgi:4-hydroxy-tetrahydrodipicolinate synthase